MHRIAATVAVLFKARRARGLGERNKAGVDHVIDGTPGGPASYLDITREQNRSLIIGIKGSAASLGGVAGPLLVAVLGPVFGASEVFAASASLALAAALVAVVALRFKRSATVGQDELVNERAPVVTAAVRGIATAALVARGRSWAKEGVA